MFEGWLCAFCWWWVNLYNYYRSSRSVLRLFLFESGLSSVYVADGCVKVLPSCRTSRVVRPYSRLSGGCRLVFASWEYVLCGGCEGGRLFLECETGRFIHSLFYYICFSLLCRRASLCKYCGDAIGVGECCSAGGWCGVCYSGDLCSGVMGRWRWLWDLRWCGFVRGAIMCWVGGAYM
jgi:hypothetical protein